MPEIRVPLEAASAAVPQSGLDVELEGTLDYQACDNVVCLRPSAVPVRIPVHIEPDPTRPAR